MHVPACCCMPNAGWATIPVSTWAPASLPACRWNGIGAGLRVHACQLRIMYAGRRRSTHTFPVSVPRTSIRTQTLSSCTRSNFAVYSLTAASPFARTFSTMGATYSPHMAGRHTAEGALRPHSILTHTLIYVCKPSDKLELAARHCIPSLESLRKHTTSISCRIGAFTHLQAGGCIHATTQRSVLKKPHACPHPHRRKDGREVNPWPRQHLLHLCRAQLVQLVGPHCLGCSCCHNDELGLLLFVEPTNDARGHRRTYRKRGYTGL